MKTLHHDTAGCFLTRDNGGVTEILLIYKNWAPDNQSWVVPKGHIEKDESPEQAALRETREETGYQSIEIVKPLKSSHIEYILQDGSLHKKDVHYFLAVLKDDFQVAPQLEASEAKTQEATKWFNLEEAMQAIKFDDLKEILSELIEELK